MSRTTYKTHAKIITTANMEVVNTLLCESAKIVRKVYKDMDPSVDDLMMSLTSWCHWPEQLFATTMTGLVIDFIVMSLYCNDTIRRQKHGQIKKMAWPAHWQQLQLPWILWWHGGGREIVQVLSDGDSRTFKHLCDLHLYGNDVMITKECVNHDSRWTRARKGDTGDNHQADWLLWKGHSQPSQRRGWNAQCSLRHILPCLVHKRKKTASNGR